ncbi:MAG: Scaffold-type E3 ligase [Bogoriella megaspora]|nr:MAG: Scaffold-type E3 ligase [Bogoriella megaspora]
MPSNKRKADELTKRASKASKVTIQTKVLKKLESDEEQSSSKNDAYTSQQRGQMQQFSNFTQADSRTAARVLKAHNWNLQAAINDHLENGTRTTESPLKAPVNKIFDKYRDDPSEPDTIGVGGTMRLFKDMNVNLEGIDSLIAAEVIGCETIGEIKRKPFVDSWSQHNCDTVPKMGSFISTRSSSISSPTSRDLYTTVYKHTFRLALSPGQKAAPLESAIEYWRTLFGGGDSILWKTKTAPWLDFWIEFLETKIKKSVNRDLWDQTLVFAERVMRDESLKWYDDESAWPSVIDEFVEWVRDVKGVGRVKENGGDVEMES